jgi:hypothetical protein
MIQNAIDAGFIMQLLHDVLHKDCNAETVRNLIIFQKNAGARDNGCSNNRSRSNNNEELAGRRQNLPTHRRPSLDHQRIG